MNKCFPSVFSKPGSLLLDFMKPVASLSPDLKTKEPLNFQQEVSKEWKPCYYDLNFRFATFFYKTFNKSDFILEEQIPHNIV